MIITSFSPQIFSQFPVSESNRSPYDSKVLHNPAIHSPPDSIYVFHSCLLCVSFPGVLAIPQKKQTGSCLRDFVTSCPVWKVLPLDFCIIYSLNSLLTLFKVCHPDHWKVWHHPVPSDLGHQPSTFLTSCFPGRVYCLSVVVLPM